MRFFNLLSIIALILLNSCFLFRGSRNYNHDNCYDDVIVTDNDCRDTIYYNPNDYTNYDYQDIILISGTRDSVIMGYSGGNVSVRSRDYVSVSSDTVMMASNNQRDGFGTVIYKVPDTMKVGKTYRIELRISKYNTPEFTQGVSENAVQKPIRIGRSMETRLVSPDDAFEIKTDNTPTQTIEMDSSYTDWVWFVTPTKSGDHYLRLLIVIKEDNLTKDIPVYDGVIHVKSSPTWTVWEFIKKYWQWMLGTLVIPFSVWWYNKKKKKKTVARKKKKVVKKRNI
jgi:hypothetical protein